MYPISQKSLRTLLLSLCLLCLAAAGLAGESADSPPLRTDVAGETLITEIETLLPVLMQDGRIPGMSAALIKDGKIIWSGSFGIRKAPDGAAVNDSTVFQAASLSKPVFAYAVMKMVERGQLDLDKPLSLYLPDYVDDPRISSITARKVLSHTTGFPNWRPRDGELEIRFDPGQKFSYSGEGYVYLQRVIEKLNNQSLQAFMAAEVLTPLGMRHSSYEWREAYKDNYAVGHGEFGVAAERDPMTEGNAAFSLYTTATDYAKFVVAVLQRNGLAARTVASMLSPEIHLNVTCVTCTNNTSTALSDENAWGLGWGLQLTSEGTSFWHWGDQGIFRCYTVAFDRQKFGLVYFTNSENGLSIREELINSILGGQHPAFTWLQYDRYDAPIVTFKRVVVDDGIEAGMGQYNSFKQQGQAPYPERAMNNFGYQLMRMQRIEDAIAIFKLNVEEYPEAWNVYDSLGEAYMENGQKELAIENYQKSLEINPENQNGQRMLDKLLEQ